MYFFICLSTYKYVCFPFQFTRVSAFFFSLQFAYTTRLGLLFESACPRKAIRTISPKVMLLYRKCSGLCLALLERCFRRTNTRFQTRPLAANLKTWVLFWVVRFWCLVTSLCSFYFWFERSLQNKTTPFASVLS